MVDVTLAGAFLAGLISFISPCVLPIVPSYLCFLAGVTSEQFTTGTLTFAQRAHIVYSAIAFVLGFSVVFIALGAAATQVGQFVSAYFDILSIIAGVIIIIFGLHFLGVWRIMLLYREVRAQVDARPASLLGAFVVGLAFAFGWTPCAGPILAAILFTAGAQETTGAGALLLGAYAAGIGVPFIIAGVFAGAFLGFLRGMRGYMGTIEKVMGVMLVVTGVLFMTGQMPRIAAWLLQEFPQLQSFG